jgi:hypothetical protein
MVFSLFSFFINYKINKKERINFLEILTIFPKSSAFIMVGGEIYVYTSFEKQMSFIKKKILSFFCGVPRSASYLWICKWKEHRAFDPQ